MAADTYKHLSMLRILYGSCTAALDAFRAADNPVDEQLVVDLETMVTRGRGARSNASQSFSGTPPRASGGGQPTRRPQSSHMTAYFFTPAGVTAI
jgi:hypothetical protein